MSTANSDVSNIRMVFWAESVERPDYGTTSLDVAAAFLNVPNAEG